jgi:hypothetical protein
MDWTDGPIPNPVHARLEPRLSFCYAITGNVMGRDLRPRMTSPVIPYNSVDVGGGRRLYYDYRAEIYLQVKSYVGPGGWDLFRAGQLR